MLAVACTAVLIEQGFSARDRRRVGGLWRRIDDDRPWLEGRQRRAAAEFENQQPADIAQIAGHRGGLAAAQRIAATPAAQYSNVLFAAHLECTGRCNNPRLGKHRPKLLTTIRSVYIEVSSRI